MTTEDKQELRLLDFEGTLVKLGKNTYIVPPLPITQMQKGGFFTLQKDLVAAEKMADPEVVGALTVKLLDFMFLAIKMNYPDATREETVDLVNTSTLRLLSMALIDVQEGLEIIKNA